MRSAFSLEGILRALPDRPLPGSVTVIFACARINVFSENEETAGTDVSSKQDIGG